MEYKKALHLKKWSAFSDKFFAKTHCLSVSLKHQCIDPFRQANDHYDAQWSYRFILGRYRAGCRASSVPAVFTWTVAHGTGKNREKHSPHRSGRAHRRDQRNMSGLGHIEKGTLRPNDQIPAAQGRLQALNLNSDIAFIETPISFGINTLKREVSTSPKLDLL